VPFYLPSAVEKKTKKNNSVVLYIYTVEFR